MPNMCDEEGDVCRLCMKWSLSEIMRSVPAPICSTGSIGRLNGMSKCERCHSYLFISLFMFIEMNIPIA